MNGHERIKNESREWLANSLMDLMSRKPYKDITIGQIANHAKLSRRTFYRAFKSKEDILDYITDMICSKYEEHLSVYNLEEFELGTISYIFFSFFEKYYHILKIFRENNMEYQLLKLFNRYLPVLCRNVYQKDLTPEESFYLQHFHLFTSGGFFNVLIFWLDNDRHMPAEEMSAIITNSQKMFWNIKA